MAKRRRLGMTLGVIMAGLLALLALLAACGQLPGDGGGSRVATKQIGPAGGSLTSTDGRLTLSIPAGALGNTETITIEEIGLEALGPEFDALRAEAEIGKAYELGPDGLSFASPVTVSFISDQEPLQDDGSLEVAAEFLLTSEGGAVTALAEPSQEMDAEGQVRVSGQLSHFSPLLDSKFEGLANFRIEGVPDQVQVDQEFAVTVTASTSRIRAINAYYGYIGHVPIVANQHPEGDDLSIDLDEVGGGQFQGVFTYRCIDAGSPTFTAFVGLHFGDVQPIGMEWFAKRIHSYMFEKVVRCIEPTGTPNSVTISTFVNGQQADPAWAGFQDGADSLWQFLEPSDGLYNFTVTDPNGEAGFAIACEGEQAGTPHVHWQVVRFTLGEATDFPLSCNPPRSDVTLTVDLSALSGDSLFSVFLGNQAVFDVPGGSSASLSTYPGEHDVVVTRSVFDNPLIADRLWIWGSYGLPTDQEIAVDPGAAIELVPGPGIGVEGAQAGGDVFVGLDMFTPGGTGANLGTALNPGDAAAFFNILPPGAMMPEPRYGTFAGQITPRGSNEFEGTFRMTVHDAAQLSDEPGWTETLPEPFGAASVDPFDSGFRGCFDPYAVEDTLTWSNLNLSGHNGIAYVTHEELVTPGFLGDPVGGQHCHTFANFDGATGVLPEWRFQEVPPDGLNVDVGALSIRPADNAEEFLDAWHSTVYNNFQPGWQLFSSTRSLTLLPE